MHFPDQAPNDDPTQPVGTDLKTLQAVLLSAYQQTQGNQMLHIGGFTPWLCELDLFVVLAANALTELFVTCLQTSIRTATLRTTTAEWRRSGRPRWLCQVCWLRGGLPRSALSSLSLV